MCSRFERASVRAATIALTALAVVMGAHYAPFFSGDAVIHLVLIENSAHGGWFEFNPGFPEASSSSILWTLLGTALVHLGGALQFAIYGLKSICFALWSQSACCLTRSLGALVPPVPMLGSAARWLWRCPGPR